MEPTKRVSTLVRNVWALMLGAAILGIWIGAESIKKPDMDGNTPAADLIFQPVPMLIAVAAAIATYVIAWLISADLEVGRGWIARKRPKPLLRIAAPEVVRVVRTRGKVGQQSGKNLAEIAFTVTTQDGRSLHVAESAWHRAPDAIGPFYAEALTYACTAALRGLAAGQPYVAGNVALFADRIEIAGQAIPVASIGKVYVVIGTATRIFVGDLADRVVAHLPDDEMLLQLIAKLGRPVEYSRAR